MIKKLIKKGITASKNSIQRETSFEYREQFWSFVGAFFGIGLLAFFQSYLLPQSENVLLIASFGASSVLLYGAIQSPFSQPRNLIFGHLISAIMGVTVYKVLPDIIWLTAPLSVALAIVFMQITKTIHPPGGATALIAVIGTEKIKALGYMYVISPVLIGSIVLFMVALIFNNMASHRKYPTDRRFMNVIRRLFLKKKI